MKHSHSKITSFYIKHTWLTLSFFAVAIVLLTLFLFTSYTTFPNTTSPNPISYEQQPLQEIEFDVNPESLPGFQKKEALASGKTKYYYASSNADRPNILIMAGENVALFQRTVSSSATPLATLDTYKNAYGEPEAISGSLFYGPEATTYIYASIGLAFTANAQTNQVFEEHLFTPMPVAEYMQQYGEGTKKP